MQKTHAQFLVDLKTRTSQIKVLTTYIGSTTNVKVKHTECKHTWEITPANLLKGRINCPTCSNPHRMKTHKEFLTQLKEITADIVPLDRYTGRAIHINFKHKKCGHIWKATPNNLLMGTGCPACKNKLKYSAIVDEYVRGYEPQAIEFIIKSKLAKAKDLQVSGIPYVKYVYREAEHRYHPDILVKSQNRIVEVKSLGTLGVVKSSGRFKLDEIELFEKTKAKRLGCLNAGFKFTLMLIDKNGNRVELPKNWHILTLKQLRTKLDS